MTIYKSDRTEGRKTPADAVHLKTLCTGCKTPVDCYWPPTMTFGGKPCTAEEYMAKVMQAENVGIHCDDCLEKMPDVKLEDLHFEPNVKRMHPLPARAEGYYRVGVRTMVKRRKHSGW